MKVCYFVSEYPAVSHTFIRREIVALERSDDHNITIFRVSLRQNARKLVDLADLDEKVRTRYVFSQSIVTFVAALAVAMAQTPRALFSAARVAVRMMRRSSRPVVFHLAYLVEALVLARWLREQQVDHIHAHFGHNSAEVAMLSHLLTAIPYSFSIHGPDEFDKPEYLGLAEKVKHAVFVRTVSSFTSGQLCRWTPPSEWRKFKVVRCGLDADFAAPCQTVDLSRNHLAIVGRLSVEKGHLVLLDALALLGRQGVPFKVTIAGDGPLRPVLAQRIRALGLDDQVEITGWLSNLEVRALIWSARAVVLPSLAEGLPVVLMEALALSRPVITTYIAGIPELVTDGLCGWLVPAGSVDRLSSAIKECLKAPDTKIRAMGLAGRKRVLEMHDIDRECRKLAMLFRGDECLSLSDGESTSGYGTGEISETNSRGVPAPSSLKRVNGTLLVREDSPQVDP